MIVPVPPPLGQDIIYPESDGLPMADNTRQFRWMAVLHGNLSAVYHERDDVFVASNLFWYPVEGHPEIRLAPDVLLVFGRPKGERGSYQQWREGGVPLSVVFEILSPSNTVLEMDDKHAFYEQYGVDEYYLYDPETNRLAIYVRQGNVLGRVRPVAGFVSPRLGIRFDLSGPEMVVYGPDGQPFLTFEQLQATRKRVERELAEAEKRAQHAQEQAEQARQQTVRLAELSRKARRGQATADELQELERLESQAGPPT